MRERERDPPSLWPSGLLAVLELSPEHSLISRAGWEEEPPPTEQDFLLGKGRGRGSPLGGRNWLFLRSWAAGLSLSAMREERGR